MKLLARLAFKVRIQTVTAFACLSALTSLWAPTAQAQDVKGGPNFETQLHIVSIKVPQAGKGPELREALLSLVEPTHAEAGCLTYEIFESEDGRLFLFETSPCAKMR